MRSSVSWLVCLVLLGFSLEGRARDLGSLQDKIIETHPDLMALRAELSVLTARSGLGALEQIWRYGVAGGAQRLHEDDQDKSAGLAFAYVEKNLYNGGLTRRYEDLLDAERAKLEWELSVRELELRKDIETDFVTLAYWKEKLEIRKAERRLYAEHKTKAERRVRAGLLGQADLLEYELRMQSALEEEASCESEAAKIEAKLLQQIGEAEGPVRTDVLPSLPEAFVLPTEAMTLSRQERSLELERSSLARENGLIAARDVPRLDFEARGGYLPLDDASERQKPAWELLLVARYEISDRRRIQAERHVQLREGEARQARSRANVAASKREAHGLAQDLQALLKRNAVLSRSRKSSDRYYAATLSEYERGVKNSPDVAHASEIVMENRLKDLEIRFAWKTTRIALEKILGREL